MKWKNTKIVKFLTKFYQMRNSTQILPAPSNFKMINAKYKLIPINTQHHLRFAGRVSLGTYILSEDTRN